MIWFNMERKFLEVLSVYSMLSVSVPFLYFYVSNVATPTKCSLHTPQIDDTLS